MDELKKPPVLQLRHNNSDGFVYAYEVDEMNKYLSEVDKVIAEKDTEIAELKEQVHDYEQGLYVMQARLEKEVCHHKYKRCWNMARFCKREKERHQMGEKVHLYGWDFWNKWERKWLELANKFKETK